MALSFFFGLSVFSFAQEAQISFAEGRDFALNSGGERRVYQASMLNSTGLSMRREDILQTSHDSFVELRLEPGGTRIKIAENTSLVCKIFLDCNPRYLAFFRSGLFTFTI